MPLEPMTPDQVDALGRMNKKIYEEYRNLGFAGISVDAARYLAFRKLTKNEKFMELVVSDAGVFFADTARKIKYRFNPHFFFVYHDGLHPADAQKVKTTPDPVILLDNCLEFWNRPGTGLCLVADHLNHCDYLFPEQKAELQRVQSLRSKGELVINPMLHRKVKETQKPTIGVLDLEDSSS